MFARCTVALASLTLSVTPLLCQHVTGLVRDSVSREPIAGAVVMTQDALSFIADPKARSRYTSWG